MKQMTESQKGIVKKLQDDYAAWADKMEKESTGSRTSRPERRPRQRRSQADAINAHVRRSSSTSAAHGMPIPLRIQQVCGEGAKGLRDSFDVEPLRKTVVSQSKQIEELKGELAKVPPVVDRAKERRTVRFR